MIYEDVGRIDIDSRMSATKEKMTGWLEEATRRRPSLLILDGLDSLLRPEHEVCLLVCNRHSQLTPTVDTVIESNCLGRSFLSSLFDHQPSVRSLGHRDRHE